ncbi:MAG TPA: hypothetical protein DDX39_01125 [Bacteroidales bacterium]|nr:MAG: hypothetical protein A2W98_06710 [Bacteroidetes bacterium GWF2_33_38]OFY75041.1 MAG: hypothetical protein A2265_12125 [Bacteroidetes bacterium RIFOXYA12_FULL_33_9]OFY90502.1 MAG: hypothetical protein A2236_06680 [Bacteroidetes bacterium RIFOXYA2_FULL_33_7]HBF87213.1 hypothetical protein [Bacteroidales bacterium]
MNDIKKISLVVFASSILMFVLVFIACFGLAFNYSLILFYVLLIVAGVGFLTYQIHKKYNQVDNFHENREQLDVEIEKTIEQKEICSYETFLTEAKKISKNEQYYSNILSMLSKKCELALGIFYIQNNNQSFNVVGQYALPSDYESTIVFEQDSFNSQAMQNKKPLIIKEIPANYFEPFSGLGKSLPTTIVFIPLMFKETAVGQIEIALFKLNIEKENVFSQISKNLIADLEIK